MIVTDGEVEIRYVMPTDRASEQVRFCHLRLDYQQDHRGVKGRIRCMRGFKSFASAERFCRSHDELRDFLRLRTRHNQHVPADRRRRLHLRRATAALAILEAA